MSGWQGRARTESHDTTSTELSEINRDEWDDDVKAERVISLEIASMPKLPTDEGYSSVRRLDKQL